MNSHLLDDLPGAQTELPLNPANLVLDLRKLDGHPGEINAIVALDQRVPPPFGSLAQ